MKENNISDNKTKDNCNHEHHHLKKSSKNILVAFLLNFFFIVVEVVGGLLTNSIAILSDAVHDFGDTLAIGGAFVLEKKSEQKPNQNYTYGYKRYSLISALITSLILLAGGAVVVVSAINRIKNPAAISGIGMLVIAIFGVLINGAAAFKTHGGKNINEKSISLHMLEDVLTWAVVLVGSIFVALFNWYIIDPILSILVTIYIVFNAIKNISFVFSIVLEKTPKGFDMTGFKQTLSQIVNVKKLHHVHVWTLDGEILLATLHAEVDDNLTKQQIAEVKSNIKSQCLKFSISHLTIQIDSELEHCCEDECKINEIESESHCHHHH